MIFYLPTPVPDPTPIPTPDSSLGNPVSSQCWPFMLFSVLVSDVILCRPVLGDTWGGGGELASTFNTWSSLYYIFAFCSSSSKMSDGSSFKMGR